MIDYRTLRDWPFPVIEHTYTTDDTMRYALAIGLGDDPVDENQLQFVNDVRPGLPLAMPTMAVVLGFPGSWMNDPATGIDFSKIVHGDELLEIHRPLPAAGTVLAHHRVVRIVDKGTGRGATITYEKELFDKSDGTKLATVRHTTFARGDGGFSREAGLTDEALTAPAPVPVSAPDRVCEIATLPQQALLYRLCADRNPLHSEPSVAIKAGFARPILHGLCTYGIAGRVMLAQWCACDPQRLKSLFVRFSAPVFPGETLRFEMHEDRGAIAFRAWSTQRSQVVLDYGRAELR
ncbi:MaoC/PaaZ C-terminal domain-containing protein [Hydrogenophaga sp. OTU3427]|uniref:MaoC/PaaZ C-terminal domain-containing protein n=1 Tax=Hydrogenophaga sp. OTU3427 TaxID=3043856 RepID=UPI00313C2BF2